MRMRRATCIGFAPAPRRCGFTLIELLVVIALIAVLAGLVASATYRVILTQQQNLSEATLRTVAKALDQQWKEVVNQANKEVIPDWVFTVAGRDPNGTTANDLPNYVQRARVIWIKVRLKQAFPMSFAEAINGPWPGQMTGLPSYINSLGKMGVTGPNARVTPQDPE